MKGYQDIRVEMKKQSKVDFLGVYAMIVATSAVGCIAYFLLVYGQH